MSSLFYYLPVTHPLHPRLPTTTSERDMSRVSVCQHTDALCTGRPRFPLSLQFLHFTVTHWDGVNTDQKTLIFILRNSKIIVESSFLVVANLLEAGQWGWRYLKLVLSDSYAKLVVESWLIRTRKLTLGSVSLCPEVCFCLFKLKLCQQLCVSVVGTGKSWSSVARHGKSDV